VKAASLKAPGGYDHIHILEAPDPGAPAAGEIRVAVKATSLNFHDMLVANGTMATADGRILMADGGGVVEAVGEAVTDFKPGDHVVSCFFPQWEDGAPWGAVGNFALTPGDGVNGFALEYAVRPAAAFTHAPKGWSHAESATITTAGMTAWRALVEDGHLKAGDTVLTLGTGGVSIAALHICRMMGASLIITSSSGEKLDRARALGAAYGINYRENPAWGKEVLKLTGGRGVDHVLETSGPGTLEQSIRAVRVGGHISLIGVLTGQRGEVPTSLLMAKQARLQGLIVGNRRQQRDYVTALEGSGIRPVIDRTFALQDLADAFRWQEAGKHFGKICVEWS
jgi:NADPH:quinone reductase-like Zn-dependent oxidoreductase